VAKTLVFYATTARYDFKIYDLGTTYQGFDFTPPIEIGCAEWDHTVPAAGQRTARNCSKHLYGTFFPHWGYTRP
jgi:hypothetical protein